MEVFLEKQRRKKLCVEKKNPLHLLINVPAGDSGNNGKSQKTFSCISEEARVSGSVCDEISNRSTLDSEPNEIPSSANLQSSSSNSVISYNVPSSSSMTDTKCDLVSTRILSDFQHLSTKGKLALLLKLPQGSEPNYTSKICRSLNGLGSRTEISQTIMWIQTHFMEDSYVSMPKKDVYDDYLQFCSSSGIKALSTADFGKVMKQVYANVRPRRLGTRGNSRYCYAGLRKRARLQQPELPDLAIKTEKDKDQYYHHEECLDGGAVSTIICKWATNILDIPFTSLSQLARHIIDATSIVNPSHVVFQPSSFTETSNMPSASTGGGHREAQQHLQHNLQEKEKRKQKRKVQEQGVCENGIKKSRIVNGKRVPLRKSPSTSCKKKGGTDEFIIPTSTSTVCKIPIPRLQKGKIQNIIVLPSAIPPVQTVQNKYKLIQPKAAICNEDEELGCYFNNKILEKANKKNESRTIGDSLVDDVQSIQISQLRSLLEINLVDRPPPILPPLEAWRKNRRVSFEPTSEGNSVPPSPETRTQYFNFTPISPMESPACRSRHNSGQPQLQVIPLSTSACDTPHSEVSRLATCGSENSTPFISPHSTPVPFNRSRHSSSSGWILPLQQQSHSRHSSGSLFAVPENVRSRHSSSGSVPQSPSSPERIRHTSDVEVSELLHKGAPQPLTFQNQARSQSVPIHQMLPGHNSTDPPHSYPSTPLVNQQFFFPTPVPSEYADFDEELDDLLTNALETLPTSSYIEECILNELASQSALADQSAVPVQYQMP